MIGLVGDRTLALSRPDISVISLDISVISLDISVIKISIGRRIQAYRPFVHSNYTIITGEKAPPQ